VVQEFWKSLSYNQRLVAVVGSVAVSVVVAYKLLNTKKPYKNKIQNPKKDFVYLFQWPPVDSWGKQSASPFCSKVELFLKWNNIAHEVRNVISTGPKGKAPYIEFNGEVISDSAIIIDHLTKHFSIQLDSKFTAKELSVARAFRIMFEEHLYFCLTYVRWVLPEGWKVSEPAFFGNLPGFLKLLGIPGMARKDVIKLNWYQGTGRHSREEVIDFAKKDLKTFSDFLGDKSFLLGDFPCIDDFAIWAILDSLMFNAPPEIHAQYNSLPNLAKYRDRFADAFKSDKKTN